MTEFLKTVRNAWQTYTALVLMAGALVAFAGVPARLSALEAWKDDTEPVLRYIACVMKTQADGADPRACGSHLNPDLVDYLRPRVP